ncbi:hypothetical protein DXG03_002139 [Asterophora parasitica]|uniref:Uncharacterized protein n=1 Tax=Asterophora parasitica TaxID=117018 RepID=A0A9P7K6A3_9AGAR|nr:hypothetical protein DXG03_002139 [Asterophora parasitica]
MKWTDASSPNTSSGKTTTHSIFPTEQTDVHLWFTLVSLVWGSVNPEGAYLRTRHSQLYVEELRRYKGFTRWHHFLVVKVRDGEGGYRYFRIERTFKDPNVYCLCGTSKWFPFPVIVQNHNCHDTASASGTPSLPCVVRPIVCDIVTPVKSLRPSWSAILIERTRFQNLTIKPTVLDIILLAHCTDVHKEGHHRFERQSFWSSIIVATALLKEFPGDMSLIHSDLLEDQEEIDSDADNPPLAHTPEKPSGHWHTFKIQDVLSKQVDPVHAAYVKLRAEAHAEIAESIRILSDAEAREARIKALQEATEDSNARTKALTVQAAQDRAAAAKAKAAAEIDRAAVEEMEATFKAMQEALARSNALWEGIKERRAEVQTAAAEAHTEEAEMARKMRDLEMEIVRFRQLQTRLKEIMASG